MILVVGGAGYLGSHVSKLFGSRCIVYDNLLYTDYYLQDVRFVRGDVTNYKLLKKYLDQAESVIWLAAIVGDAPCMIDPRRAIATNVDAVRFLAENFDGRIIFTSSASVYGTCSGLATEDFELNPQSLYAETKIRAEKLLEDALILRLGTLHGISDRMRFDLVVNALTRDAVMKGEISVFGGKQHRPLIHVQDTADFIRYAISENVFTPGVYNLVSENKSIREIASDINSVAGITINMVDTPFEDKRDYMVSTEKLETDYFELTAQALTKASARSMAELLTSGRIKDPYDARYANLSALERIWKNQG